MRTYAIGDVHGRADLLEALLTFIEKENQAGASDHRIVFLGDLIDRGPQSCEVMSLAVDVLRRLPSSRLILGNHEEFLLYFLDLPEKREIVFDHWMRNGGIQCATSYGLDVSRQYKNIEEAHDDLLALLEAHPDHISMLRQASSHVRSPGRIFVHAGLRPGIGIADQSAKDMRTIRGDFLKSGYNFGAMVVHGHTETKSGRPEIYANRIALDTGAFSSGILTALACEEGEDDVYLATKVRSKGVTVSPIEPLYVVEDAESKLREASRVSDVYGTL